MSLPNLNAPVRVDNIRRTPTTFTCTLSFSRVVEVDEIMASGNAAVDRTSKSVTLDVRLWAVLNRLPDSAAIALRDELYAAARSALTSTQPSEQTLKCLDLDE